MADVLWPLTKKPSDISETTVSSRIRNDFANNQPIVRNAFTRKRKKFSLTWDESGYHALTHEEKTTLDDFFKEHSASSITWTHPWTGSTFTVIFTDDELNFSLIHPEVPGYDGWWSVTVNLEEL